MSPAWSRLITGSVSAAAGEEDLDQQLEVIRELTTCPKCGGERYKDQRQPRSASNSA
jgi:hypothetical protein